MTTVRLAVMSDIHADERDSGDTRIFLEPAASHRGQDPLYDLDRLVRSEGIRAQYLLLPGDTANKANAEGLSYGWRRAHTLADAMEARLLAAPGNHDVVTRITASDGALALKNLLPTFPTGDLDLDSQFWASGWCVLERSDHRVLILDTTADFPPYPSAAMPGSQELADYLSLIERGGLAQGVEEELVDYLATADAKLNIALFHHHPVEHQLHDYLQDYHGPMRRGGEIIDILTNSSAGRWLIVHGHKHIPQLVSATTVSMNGPVVLCAGSIGAKIWDPVTTVARNQFHVLDVSLDGTQTEVGLAGTIESYTWAVGNGWYRSEQRGSGLPGTAGFGNNIEPGLLAARIERLVPPTPGQFVRVEEVLASVPQLPFVLPGDWDILEEQAGLRGIQFIRDRKQSLVSIAREVASAR